MKIIGVTGGVGAGKSTVLEILKEDYGAGILMADEIGRELMEPEGACFAQVRDAFGEGVMKRDGTLDRGKIASAVFRDQAALKRLNGIIHPAVRKETERRLQDLEISGKEIAVIETAILFEAGYEDICDVVWYVYADEETRIQRLMKSRGYGRDKCREIMANQMPDSEFRRRSGVVIDNSGSREDIKEQIATSLSL
ncbi:dephospho-CoA kinase [Qiania dongpingensis]|uniref:Dephospho-CoA kinase n=1 Tax=Qiania dongpingensis TaxID=2763669 RepID=A0A7G9G532_9FIRM|nr:dephospho-CoA kinase [Qiania dongpingensis]QNM05914.1 dephospho-CoA kinase [Qiania dongpingensis]